MAQEKTKIVMGTATPGGGFPAYGWPYAEILNATDPTLGIEPINTKGSNENVVSLDEGELDLGLVTGEVTYEAITRARRAQEGEQPAHHQRHLLAGGHVHGEGRQPVQEHLRPQGQADRVGRGELRFHRARALRHGRPRPRHEEGLRAAPAGEGGRRSAHGARRDAPRRCGAAAWAGRRSWRSRKGRPACASSRPRPTRSSASRRSIRS